MLSVLHDSFFWSGFPWVEGLTPVTYTQGGAAELWMAFGYRAVRAPRQKWSHTTGCRDPRMRHICWNNSANSVLVLLDLGQLLGTG